MTIQGLGSAVTVPMLNETQSATLTNLFREILSDKVKPVAARVDLRARQVADLTNQGKFQGFFTNIASCLRVLLSDLGRFFSGAQRTEDKVFNEAHKGRLDAISKEITGAIESLETALNVQKAAVMTIGYGNILMDTRADHYIAQTMSHSVRQGLEKLPTAIDVAVEKIVNITDGDISRVRETLDSLANTATSVADKMNINRLIASFVEKSAERIVEKEISKLDRIPSTDDLFELYADVLESNSYGLPDIRTGEMQLLNRTDNEGYFNDLFNTTSLYPEQIQEQFNETLALDEEVLQALLTTKTEGSIGQSIALNTLKPVFDALAKAEVQHDKQIQAFLKRFSETTEGLRLARADFSTRLDQAASMELGLLSNEMQASVAEERYVSLWRSKELELATKFRLAAGSLMKGINVVNEFALLKHTTALTTLSDNLAANAADITAHALLEKMGVSVPEYTEEAYKSEVKSNATVFLGRPSKAEMAALLAETEAKAGSGSDSPGMTDPYALESDGEEAVTIESTPPTPLTRAQRMLLHPIAHSEE